MKRRKGATVYISIGSNLGDRPQNIISSLRLMEEEEGIKLRKVSPLYETEAVGYKDQPWFLNGVARIETTLLPEELLIRLQAMETKLGKKTEVRWGPRSIDLDILLYGKISLNLPNLQIPHNLMHQRAFVLAPLAQIAPGVKHPVLNKTIKTLLAELKETEVVKLYSGGGN